MLDVLALSIQLSPVDLHHFKTSFFNSFMLFCTSVVLRARGIVCVLYLLFRFADALQGFLEAKHVYEITRLK